MDPAGKFLYAMNTHYSEVFVYFIDQNTGALTLGTNSPLQTQYYYPTVFTLDATGQLAYIAYQAGRSNGPAISAYRIDPTSGSFSLVPGSPFIVPNDASAANKNGPSLTWAAAHPSAGFLYAADSNQLDLWTFAIDGASGALTLTPTSPTHMPHGSNQFAFDPTGGFAGTVVPGQIVLWV
jgi:6-phosphogluconolactonase (cycloisomerase 2 family)